MVTWFLLLACTGGDKDPVNGDTAAFVDGELLLGEVLTCESPAATVSYTEVGAAWGLATVADPEGDHQEGGSLALLDVDLDGDTDMVTVIPQMPLQLWRNQGSRFDWEEIDGPFDPWLLSLADVDEDGRLDLLVGSVFPALLRGEGEDFAPMEELDRPDDFQPSSVAKSLAMMDLDEDGHVDIYGVVNAGGMEPTGPELADFVWWGAGDGSFTVDTAAVPATGERRGFDAGPLRWQGRTAVYVANDMGIDFGGNVLFEAGSRTLEDRSEDCFCGERHSAMGLDVGDWNQDGLDDLYVAAVPYNILFTAQDDGSFVDMSAATGSEGLLERWGMAWGAGFLDYDNDGQIDILDAQGDQWSASMPEGIVLPQPIWLLRQDQGQFTEVGTDMGFPTEGSWRSLGAADFNADGVLDLVVTDVVDRPHLFLSDSCTANTWLEVAAPAGSRVEVEAGGTVHYATVEMRMGYGGAHAPRVHLGLGSAELVDEVRITLPSGEVLMTTEAFAPRRELVVPGTPGVPL